VGRNFNSLVDQLNRQPVFPIDVNKKVRYRRQTALQRGKLWQK